MQVSISAASSTSPVFEYLRRFLEITFVVVLLHAIVKVIPSLNARGAGAATGGGAGSIAARQLSTLMVNMQRTFAETVANIVVDPELRRLVVLWGACILPSISRLLGRYDVHMLHWSAQTSFIFKEWIGVQ